MKTNLLLLIAMLIFVGCQASGGGGNGGGVVDGHVPSENVFTLKTALNKSYSTGQNIDLTLSFPAYVTVTGNPELTLTIGSTQRTAPYVSGSGTKTLLFRYTVAAGESDSDGISLAGSIALNGATLTYGANVACPSTFAVPNLASVKVDTSAPSLVSLEPPQDKNYYFGQSVTFKATFSETMSVSGSPRILIDVAGATRAASYISGSGTSTLFFSYVVTATDYDDNGIGVTSPISLNGGALQDSSGNALSSLAFTVPVTSGVKVLGASPYVVKITPPAAGTYDSGQNLDFTLGFNKSVVVTGTPSLTLTVGTVTVDANYLSGSGTASLKFRYTVAPGDVDSDGISLEGLINQASGSIQDSASHSVNPSIVAPVLSKVKVSASIAPVIVTVAAPASPPVTGYDAGGTVDFVVTFSQNVTDTSETSRLPINMGGTTVYADYSSGSGTKTFTYRYIVSSGEEDLDGVQLAGNLDLNGSSVQNAAGLEVSPLTFTPPSTSNVRVDAKAPILAANTVPASGKYTTGQNLDFDVTFHEPVFVTGSPTLAIDVGGENLTATYLSGSSSNTLRFRYTVGSTENDNDGIGLGGAVDVGAGSILDPNQHPAALTLVNTDTSGILIDTTAPLIASLAAPADDSYTIGDTLTFIATFTENVTVTGTPRLAVTIGSQTRYASYKTGSGTDTLSFSYKIVLGDSDTDGIDVVSPLELNSGTIKDAVNIPAVLTFTPPDSSGVIVIGANPTISSVTAPADGRYLTNQAMNFTLVYSEAVNVTGTPRLPITTSNGTVYADYLSGSGTTSLTFRYTVASGAYDTDGITLVSPMDLNSGTIVGNVSAMNAKLTFTPPDTTQILVDGLDPVIASVSAPADKTYILGDDLDFTVTFTENVEVTGTPKLDLVIGSATVSADYQSGTGTKTLSFRYSVAGGDLDQNGIALSSPLNLTSGTIKDIFTDNAGVTFTSPVTSGVLVDAVAPVIASVAGPSPGSYYLGDHLDFVVTFSKTVNVTGTPRIGVTIGGATVFADYLSGSGSPLVTFRYTVANGDLDSDGIDTSSPLDLNGGSVKDIPGNSLDPLTFTPPNTALVMVDGTTPSIVAVTPPANATYKTGANIDFTVSFSKVVTVTGTPRLPLTVGSSNLFATYVSGSGTANLLFRYTVAAGDMDDDGITLASPLDLNGGSIADPSNVNATLTFTAPNTSGINVDGIDIIVSSVTPPVDGTYILNQNLDFVVTLNYPATVAGTPRLALTVGSATLYANYQSGSGTTNHTYRYTVGAGDAAPSGISLASDIDLNGGSVKDAFGDNAAVTFTGGSFANKKVDGVIPTISSVTAPANGTYVENENLDFSMTFSESVVVTGSPRLVLTVGSVTKYATYQSGSGTSSLTFRYSTLPGDTDLDGISLSATLDLNAGAIKDVPGNDLSALTFSAPNTSGINVDANAAYIVSLAVPADGTFKTNSSLNFTATYSRPVTVTGNPRLALTVGAATLYADYLSGSGTTALVFRYSVGAGDSDSDGIALATPIQLNSGSIKDSGNSNANLNFTAPNTSAILVDGIDLAIASVTLPADGTYILGASLDFVVNFNYPALVAGTPRLTLTVGGATRYADYVSGSGTTALTYRYTVGASDLALGGIALANNVDLNGGSIKDSFSDNANVSFTGGTYANKKVDGIVPVISSAAGPTSGLYYLGNNLDFDVTFSESVNVTGSPRIALTVGSATLSATYLSGTGTTILRFRYTVGAGDLDNDGIAAISPLFLNGGTIKDFAGNDLNPLTFTPPNTALVNVDGTAPSITSVTPPANASYKTGNTLNFTVNFTKPVNVTGSPRLSMTVGATTLYASYLSGSGTASLVFRYTVAAGDMDSDGIALNSPLELNGGSIADPSNVNATLTYTAPNTSAVLVDGIDIAIASVTLPADGSYILGANVDFIVNFNYAALVTGSPRLTLTVGGVTKYASYLSGSGTTAHTYRYTVGAGDSAPAGITLASNIDLNAGTIKDSFGDNATITFTGGTYANKKVDGIVPTISSVTAPANGTYFENDNLDFIVNLSEAVTVTGSPRILLTVGATTKYATYQAGTGTSSLTFRYTALLGDSDLDGIAMASALDLNSGGITDVAGNNLSPLTFSAPATSGIMVNANSANIISFTAPANATYNTDTNLDFTVTYSRAVTVTGTPRIALTVGAATLYANYLSGSGTTALVFRYTVGAGDADTDGIALATPIQLNGGSIKDSGNSNANVNFTPPNTSAILVDGIDLAVASVTLPADATYILGANLDFVVNFNYSAIVTGTPRLTLSVGGSAKYAVYQSGSGTTAHTYRYTVSAGDSGPTGIILHNDLGLNGGTVKDSFGDNASVTFNGGSYANKKVDGVVPVISSFAGPSPGLYILGNNLEFDVTFSESVTITGAPRVALTVGSATLYASYLSGSGTTLVRFRYTVGAGDSDTDGIAVVSPLDLNSGSIKDLSGNDLNPLTFTPPNTALVNVDGTAPQISSITPPANATYKTGNSVNFAVNFSKPVTVTGSPRIALTVGAATRYATYLSGSGSASLVFRYTVGAGDVDSDGIALTSPLELNGGTIADAASVGATLTFIAPDTSGINVDGIDIVIASVTPPANGNYGVGQNLDFTVNFNYASITTGDPQLTLTVGSETKQATYVSGSGTTAHLYRYTVGTGDFAGAGISLASNIGLNGGSIKDSFGDNATITFTGASYALKKVDGVYPQVITVTPPSPGTYYIGENLDFDIEFDESIVISGSPAITLTIGSTTRLATYVSGSGTNVIKFRYTLANGDNDGDGIVMASPLILNSGTVKDTAGNNAVLTYGVPDTSGVMTNTNSVNITGVSIPAGKYSTGSFLDVFVTFDASVFVTGTPQVKLTVGTSNILANYISGSGSSTLRFRYTVLSGDMDIDGIEVVSPILLNNGTIRDATATNATLTFITPDTSAVLVDGIDLVIGSITNPAARTYITGENLDFDVNYNYPATVAGSPRLTLTVGAATRYATYLSGTGTTVLKFRYTVGANDIDTDGVDLVSPLGLNGGSIKDIFADNASLTFTGGNAAGVNVDGVAPTISSVTGPSNGTYYTNANLDFTMNFNEAVTITGSPRLTLTVGAATKYAAYLSGSGTSSIVYRYTTVTGDTDLDGIAVASSLDLNGGAVTDLGGNNLSGPTFTAPNTTGVNVDANNASISSVTAPLNATYKTSQNVDFTVNFTRSVTVTGSPRLALTVGASTLYATYLSGSGSSALIFRYTVGAGASDSDGIAVASPLELNGGTIVDSSTASATLTFTPPNTTGVNVDGIDITISSVSLPADGTYIAAQDLDFVVNFNYAPVFTGTPRLVLTVGAATKYATYVSSSGTASTFRYSVASGDLAATGIVVASNVDLNGGTIKDSFGDNAVITFVGGTYANKKVDGVIPTISSVTAPANGTYDTAQTLTFTVAFSENVTITGSPRIALTIGSTTRYAVYAAGSGTSSATFTYTLVGADSDVDGIAVVSPLDLNGGNITDAPGNVLSPLTFTAPNTSGVLVAGNVAVAANSTITGTGPVTANGTATSTVTITLRNALNNPVAGVVPAYSATDTGTTNVYGTCAATNASGVSTCTLASTKAETKTLSITSPVSKADGTVVFQAGAAVAGNSTITGTGPVVADGAASSTVTITLKDLYNNPVSGTTPTFAATNTGTTNVYGACSATSATGVSTCSLKSTKAETKTLSITAPITKSGGTVVFQAGSAAVANSYITGTTPVSSDGISTSFIEISLRDAFNNPLTGVIPIFNATNTNATNVYGSCSSTDATGISACTLAATFAESKTLQLTSPIAVTGNVVVFSSSLPTSQNSTIAATGPVVADGATASTVTITLRDANNNLVTLANGALPTFTATDTGTTNVYTDCTNISLGVYTCPMTSRTAEVKNLSITYPVNKNNAATVTFVAGAVNTAFSTITGTGPTVADGTAASTITVTLKDLYNNAISGTVPTFSATNTGSTNVLSACSSSNASGVSTCTLKSTVAEVKTLSIVTPVAKTGGTVTFIGGAPVAANSTITGSGPVDPDGTSTSLITITLKDVYNNASAGYTPTFTATGTNNTYGSCSASNSTGVSNCTLASTTAETKTLSIATPFVKAGGTVLFQLGAPVAANSTITGTTNVVANGVATSTITITLKSSTNGGVAGVTPTFTASGTNNTYNACSVTNVSGVSTCTMTSTTAEVKTLSIATPFVKADGSVTFIAGAPAVATSTISGVDGTIADGSSTCPITITLKDAFNNPVAGVVPTFTLGGTGNVLNACSSSDTSGQSLCTATSTKAELKTLSIATPVVKAGTSVDFTTFGINTMVPIEMADIGLSSGTGAITFARTRTSLNTADYVAQTNEYQFEIIAQNTNASTAFGVSLVSNSGATIADSLIQIPANTTGPTRLRIIFTPNTGADNYRVKLPATTVAGQVVVHSAKIIVNQFRATASKVYIPLVGGDVSADSSLDNNTVAALSVTGTNLVAASTSGYGYVWNKVNANYDAIVTDATAITLEAVASSSATNRTATVALFNRNTGVEVAGLGTLTTTATTPTLITASVANSALPDANAYDLRAKSSQNISIAYVYKAGLWVKLKYLKKAEVYHRLSTRRAAATAVAIPDSRFFWEPSEWSTTSTFFEVYGTNPAGSTSSILLVDAGASDSASTGTTVSTLTPVNGYTVQRSAALSLTNLSRYIVRHNATAGSPVMGGAFMVIQTRE